MRLSSLTYYHPGQHHQHHRKDAGEKGSGKERGGEDGAGIPLFPHGAAILPSVSGIDSAVPRETRLAIQERRKKSLEKKRRRRGV